VCGSMAVTGIFRHKSGNWRKLPIVKIQNLYSLQRIIKQTILRKNEWVIYVESIQKIKILLSLVEKLLGWHPLVQLDVYNR